MRPHQWAKNAPIFVPMFAGHRTDVDAFVASLSAFIIAFSLAASATYLINDLLDLAADRAHARKRLAAVRGGRRQQFPLASGWRPRCSPWLS